MGRICVAFRWRGRNCTNNDVSIHCVGHFILFLKSPDNAMSQVLLPSLPGEETEAWRVQLDFSGSTLIWWVEPELKPRSLTPGSLSVGQFALPPQDPGTVPSGQAGEWKERKKGRKERCAGLRGAEWPHWASWLVSILGSFLQEASYCLLSTSNNPSHAKRERLQQAAVRLSCWVVGTSRSQSFSMSFRKRPPACRFSFLLGGYHHWFLDSVTEFVRLKVLQPQC